MDYIPTAINRVLKGVDSDGLPRWHNMSAHDVKVLLAPEVADEVLEEMTREGFLAEFDSLQ